MPIFFISTAPSSSISTPQLTVAGVAPFSLSSSHSPCSQRRHPCSESSLLSQPPSPLAQHGVFAPSSAMASHIQAFSPTASSSSYLVCCATSPQAPPIPFVYSTKVPLWSSSAYTSSPS
ncbi:hypothetical protein PIB30_049854 [Stylosanthes scabra]|uniref:Uncharacterized protein n=1 Tax=Stylosanthes scabra TaxID=79078 RepID=A0ABU6QH19_9FABA|nr:hypothetical protein [Stylosanthes scabra]